MSNKFDGVFVHYYVIMPNHVHLLITLNKNDGRGNPSPTIPNVVGWLKYNATKEMNDKKGTSGEKIFQRSYYDHIIRCDADLDEHVRYILDNPSNWQNDKLYSQI